MAYRDRDEDDDASDLDDRDDPLEQDMDENDDPAVVPCPYCRAEILEDVDVCPKCGNFISFEDAPRRRPWWVVAGVVVCVVVVVLGWVLS